MRAGRAGQSWRSTSPCCPPREVGIISDIGIIELRSRPHSNLPVSETPGSLAFMHGQPLSTSSQLTVHPGPNCSIVHRPWPQTAVWPPRQPEGTSSTSDPGTPAPPAEARCPLGKSLILACRSPHPCPGLLRLPHPLCPGQLPNCVNSSLQRTCTGFPEWLVPSLATSLTRGHPNALALGSPPSFLSRLPGLPPLTSKGMAHTWESCVPPVSPACRRMRTGIPTCLDPGAQTRAQ